jgi:phytoene synthase
LSGAVEMASGNGNGLGGLESDYARCAEVTRRSSSNFYYAFMLLPAERRRALHAVYAFCRFIDHIADDESAGDAAWLLNRWREELDRVYGGTPTRAISRALADSAGHFNIPRKYFEEIIAGVEMDLTRKRYANFKDLRQYCYRVASAVGLICIEIFGYTNPAARIYAEKLGIACQITNILRDVKEDAARGRIYLPLEDLARFNVTEEEILHSVYSPNFVRLMEFEAAVVDRRSDAADLWRAARSHRAIELSRTRSPPQFARAAEALPGRARMGVGAARFATRLT